MDVVPKQNQNVKREMQPKSKVKLQPTGRSKMCKHAETISLSFRFGSLAGNKGPRTSGLLLWFVSWLVAGNLCGCVAVLALGIVLCLAVLM